MKKLNESYIEEKKSKFYGFIYSIDNEDDINTIINELKNEYRKAKHIVYAYKYDNIIRNHADKEPNGTTRGLLEVIEKNDLNKVLIVVIRYFGGTLLGSGLLTRTYTKVSAMLIKK